MTTVLDDFRSLLANNAVAPPRAIPPSIGPVKPIARRHALLLITNYRSFLETITEGERQVWVLYRVDTFTPGYYYLGISSQIEQRAHRHLQAATEPNRAGTFTAKHGARSMTILAVFESLEDAQSAEWQYWSIKHQHDGERAGGFDSSRWKGLGIS